MIYPIAWRCRANLRTLGELLHIIIQEFCQFLVSLGIIIHFYLEENIPTRNDLFLLIKWNYLIDDLQGSIIFSV